MQQPLHINRPCKGAANSLDEENIMTAKRTATAIFILGLSLLLSACQGLTMVRGSGEVVTENRPVSNFERIDMSGLGELIIIQDGTESLSIEGDDNLMEHLEIGVEGRTLKLGFKPGLNVVSVTRLVYTVHVAELNALSISGSGEADIVELASERLKLDVSGSGNIQVDYLAADEVDVEISGSGHVGDDMCSETVDVEVSGSGEATVCATDFLDATVSGSGSIRYYGSPSVTSSTSGTGTVTGLGDR
jgi:hypothetical protein